MSRDEIQSMIDFSVLQVRNDMNNILTSDGAATVREITAHCIEIQTHRDTHLDTMQRITSLIDGEREEC